MNNFGSIFISIFSLVFITGLVCIITSFIVDKDYVPIPPKPVKQHYYSIPSVQKFDFHNDDANSILESDEDNDVIILEP